MKFKDLKFKLNNERLVVYLYNIFKFEIPIEELENLGLYEISEHEFLGDENRFNFLISKHIKNLVNLLSNNPSVYIHSNSEIPLIGSNYFGIVDRNTNIIELKPLTSCNLGCIFCSVDEGINSKKKIDYIIEKDYLIEEFKNIVKQKNCDEIEALVNPQGEPLLYARLSELISDLSKISEVKNIAINTNATLLTKDKVDELIKAGITRINFSLNALSKAKADELAGAKYNLSQVKEIIEYTSKKININIAPVWAHKMNDSDIEDIIVFTKELQAKTNKIIFLGIQNMMEYKFGRNPAKQIGWDEFNAKISSLEKKYDINLRNAESFKFIETKQLKKPFKKNDIIEAVLMLKGRLRNEILATSENRVISVINCHEKIGKKIKVKLIRSKHNIFTARTLS